MIMKLGMAYSELKLYTVHLDLFYSNAKFGEPCFCTYGKPRYQVSVYGTIGFFWFKFLSFGQGNKIRGSPCLVSVVICFRLCEVRFACIDGAMRELANDVKTVFNLH